MTKGKLRFGEGGVITFFCPGCKETHSIKTPGWTFDGNAENPTFSPSVLVRSGHFAPGHKEGDSCWCTYNKEHGTNDFECRRCHSFVRNGKIEFLGDCSHELRNQTVDLPEFRDD